jgi:hypothetical protein
VVVAAVSLADVADVGVGSGDGLAGVRVAGADVFGGAVGSAAGFEVAVGRPEAGEAVVRDGAGLAERAGFVGEAAGASEGAEVDDDATPVALGRGVRS